MVLDDKRSGQDYPTPPSITQPETIKYEYRQDPIAVVGLANRLPGHSTNPTKLWEFLERGGVAENAPPHSRFALAGHYDGSLKPHTIKTPGAMFLEDMDPAEFDASFFNISRADAISMDPQQRMLLEVVFEGLENAGITLERLSGDAFGCFVGSYAVDYQDIQMRDPEDRPPGITIGAGRAILSNRISHFLNIKGASMTIDTACSGSLVSVDVACRYLQTRQCSGAIVAGANLYLSPEQNQDMGAMRTASSATGKCHTFDAKADGYCKSEAINCVILKLLEDALRDGDPIRAIIRGTATNSDGWTPGIASPSPEAQAMAIRAAYAAAGIEKDALHHTGYLECHGTGTLAGDPVEVAAAASVLAVGRSPTEPLIIGSIKSNIGHSEPAAGVSGLIKAVLAVEKGIIPGNPTFVDPNPKIDFEGLKVRASRTSIKWPSKGQRIASVNSFGYGGSNAHVVLQDAESFLSQRSYKPHHTSFAPRSFDDFFDDDTETAQALARPTVLVFSANDESSLTASYDALRRHLINPSVNLKLPDIAYTLSNHRSRHFYRGFLIRDRLELPEGALIVGKKNSEAPKVGLVFTGQGAQWSQMGKAVIDHFHSARSLLESLDAALQELPDAPSWSIIDELYNFRSPDHLRRPEFSQPLVTALQLVILSILKEWGVVVHSVVGHSSGEIAAAFAAGFLTPQNAIKIAFYRGQAAKELEGEQTDPVGMMAVGLGSKDVQPYIKDLADDVQIACYNSPRSVTLSGKVADLDVIRKRLQDDSHFARMLQVNLAYHSKYMKAIGERYEQLLQLSVGSSAAGNADIAMYSSVTGSLSREPKDALYWKTNMISAVRFDEATTSLLHSQEADFLIEVGPSGALAGPIGQIKKALPGQGSGIQYFVSAKRGADSINALFDVAGRLFLSGGSIDLANVNSDPKVPETLSPSVIVDLPNYVWNHGTRYWHESDASKDWRYKPFVHHDLLGSKILGSAWPSPTFSKVLDLKDLPWLKDHKMGPDTVFPAAGFCAMAIEALFQSTLVTRPVEGISNANQLGYRLRNVRFDNALVLEENEQQKIRTILSPHSVGVNSPWFQFRVTSTVDDVTREHSSGLIRLEATETERVTGLDAEPLKNTSPGRLWYKAMSGAGYGFGPLFQKHLEIESTSGKRSSRSLVDLSPPPSAWTQSPYPLHPVCMDGCFQTVTPSLVAGIRSNIKSVLIPAVIDDLIIFPSSSHSERGVSITSSEYVGKGSPDDDKNYLSNCTVHDADSKAVLLRLSGLRYHRLDTGANSLAAHTFNSVSWKPDITLLSPHYIAPKKNSDENLQELINLVAHKKPGLSIIEVNLDSDDVTALWFDHGQDRLRGAYRSYSFGSTSATALVNVQSELGSHRDSTFSLIDLAKLDFQRPDDLVDLVLVKSSSLLPQIASKVIGNASSLLAEGGYFLLVVSEPNANIVTNGWAPSEELESLTESNNLEKIHTFHGRNKTLYLSRALTPLSASAPEIRLLNFGQPSPLSSAIKAALQSEGHRIHDHHVKTPIPQGDIALVLEELFRPLLMGIDEDSWNSIKDVITQRQKVLWVTNGSQFKITEPNLSLVHGFFRTIRAEDPGLSLTTLDIESPTKPESVSAISATLKALAYPAPKSRIDSEFAERDGVIYVSRILPDVRVNAFKNAQSIGRELEVASLHSRSSCVRLVAERLGTLDSLVFAEIAPVELPVKENCVEVEIFAAGLNFKDVAVTMGIVPENERLLGLEGAGIVRRVASDVTKYKPGDRVVVFEKGTFANRIQVTTERTHHIPEDLSFEDASTITGVYLTSLYCLFNLGNLQKGKSVLIHSAAGGIGISAIRLAQYKQAEIYITVGTEDKRKFVEEEFGIPRTRMFSSRSTNFAKEILAATNGRGIDVVLNSLTGELLDESWRICADGGTMVEIGKRDILDRNQLSMEPFDRNCSFRALDFSHKHITDALIADLLSQIFDLYSQGHVKPVHPISTFSFADIASAFAFMRSGKHIGKIVVTNSQEEDVQVPIRPALKVLALKHDAAYFIVGGLKGLCGTLAISLAQRGARKLIVMSRSGITDEHSQGIVKDCASHGCEVYEAKGDVSNFADVEKALKSAPVLIRGIINGSMVLRDKPYEAMTVDEFHTTLASKVSGTWNLHNAALQQNIELDFFTMLSSISGVVGQKGQANYAAANVFMDAFASYRQSLGLPANSTDLGVIEDVGYVASQGGMQQHFDKRQWTGIDERVLREILGYSIVQQIDPLDPATSSQLITGIPVPQPEDSGLARDARFSCLFTPEDSGSHSAGRGDDASRDINAFALLLRSGADWTVLTAAAVDIISKQLTKMLRLEELMEPGKALTAYGLDSLASVEFRNWVRLELGAELTTLEINNAPSLFWLCEKIISKIKVT